MAESVADGIVAIDREGKVIYLNPAAQLMYGYRPAEIVGKPFASPDRGAVAAPLTRRPCGNFLRERQERLIGTTRRSRAKKERRELSR